MRVGSIDGKSLCIGLLLGICVMLARGAESAAPVAATATSAPRFQISAHDAANGESIVYVLDHSNDKVYYYRGANSNFGSRQEAFQLQR